MSSTVKTAVAAKTSTLKEAARVLLLDSRQILVISSQESDSELGPVTNTAVLEPHAVRFGDIGVKA